MYRHYENLKEALLKAEPGLVLVERTVYKRGKMYIQHYWIDPNKVRNTDVVIKRASTPQSGLQPSKPINNSPKQSATHTVPIQKDTDSSIAQPSKPINNSPKQSVTQTVPTQSSINSSVAQPVTDRYIQSVTQTVHNQSDNQSATQTAPTQMDTDSSTAQPSKLIDELTQTAPTQSTYSGLVEYELKRFLSNFSSKIQVTDALKALGVTWSRSTNLKEDYIQALEAAKKEFSLGRNLYTDLAYLPSNLTTDNFIPDREDYQINAFKFQMQFNSPTEFIQSLHKLGVTWETDSDRDYEIAQYVTEELYSDGQDLEEQYRQLLEGFMPVEVDERYNESIESFKKEFGIETEDDMRNALDWLGVLSNQPIIQTDTDNSVTQTDSSIQSATQTVPTQTDTDNPIQSATQTVPTQTDTDNSVTQTDTNSFNVQTDIDSSTELATPTAVLKQAMLKGFNPSQRLQYVLSSLSTFLGESHYSAFQSIISRVPKEFIGVTDLWNIHESKVSIQTTGKGFFYNPSTGKINIPISASKAGIADDQTHYDSPYGVLFHEVAHLIDYLVTRNPYSYVYKDNLFGKTLRAEVLEFLSSAGLKDLNDTNMVLELNAELSKYKLAGFMDIVNGAIDGKVCLGHGKAYWAQSDTLLPTEAFANITADILSSNEEGIWFFQHYLHKSYQIYLEIVEELQRRQAYEL